MLVLRLNDAVPLQEKKMVKSRSLLKYSSKLHNTDLSIIGYYTNDV